MHLTSDKRIWIPDDDDWVNWSGNYEQDQFNEVMPHVSNRDVALDIGAHVGIWSMRLAQNFKRVIAFEPVPKHIECWKQNRFAEAIDLWEQIVRNNPNIAEIFYNLGNAYVYQGKIESAIESLKQAIAVDPTLIEAYNKLGCICYKQGSLDLAFASWNHALKIDPNFEEARHNLRLIQNATQFDEDNEIPAYQHVTPEEARGNGGSGAEGYDDDKPGWTNRIHRGLRKFRGQ